MNSASREWRYEDVVLDQWLNIPRLHLQRGYPHQYRITLSWLMWSYTSQYRGLAWTSMSLGSDQKVGQNNNDLISLMLIWKPRDSLQIKPLRMQSAEPNKMSWPRIQMGQRLRKSKMGFWRIFPKSQYPSFSSLCFDSTFSLWKVARLAPGQDNVKVELSRWLSCLISYYGVNFIDPDQAFDIAKRRSRSRQDNPASERDKVRRGKRWPSDGCFREPGILHLASDVLASTSPLEKSFGSIADKMMSKSSFLLWCKCHHRIILSYGSVIAVTFLSPVQNQRWKHIVFILTPSWEWKH